jgi:cytoskeletal protein RodZ
MKEIGLKLKNKREESGLSIDEVADDLKVKSSEIENLEEGNRDEFKDIIFLKSLIQDYSKYLGFDTEKMLDEFNEYLFDQTSRISIEDIEKAIEEKKESEKEKISSPYTLEKKEKNKILIYSLIVIFILVIVVCISYFIVNRNADNENNDITISYMIGG